MNIYIYIIGIGFVNFFVKSMLLVMGSVCLLIYILLYSTYIIKF